MLLDQMFLIFLFVLVYHGADIICVQKFRTNAKIYFLRFIQTAIIAPNSHVNVISKGLAYSTLSLLSTVLFLLIAIHMNSWKLDKKLG
jgi:hypothetical protein